MYSHIGGRRTPGIAKVYHGKAIHVAAGQVYPVPHRIRYLCSGRLQQVSVPLFPFLFLFSVSFSSLFLCLFLCFLGFSFLTCTGFPSLPSWSRPSTRLRTTFMLGNQPVALKVVFQKGGCKGAFFLIAIGPRWTTPTSNCSVSAPTNATFMRMMSPG